MLVHVSLMFLLRGLAAGFTAFDAFPSAPRAAGKVGIAFWIIEIAFHDKNVKLIIFLQNPFAAGNFSFISPFFYSALSFLAVKPHKETSSFSRIKSFLYVKRTAPFFSFPGFLHITTITFLFPVMPRTGNATLPLTVFSARIRFHRLGSKNTEDIGGINKFATDLHELRSSARGKGRHDIVRPFFFKPYFHAISHHDGEKVLG